MEMSDKTSDLFTAFAKFQGELSNASKDKKGHGYNYADLGMCINNAKEPLQLNGLAVTQLMGDSDKGVTLTTMLTHQSGQWLRSSFVMEKAILQGGAGKNPAQAMGASISYMRRYSYAAILGMAQEDDDAKGVTSKQPVNSSYEKPKDDDNKPWYNSFDQDKDHMVSCIQQGTDTAEGMISHLSQTYKINKEVRQKIKDLS